MRVPTPKIDPQHEGRWPADSIGKVHDDAVPIFIFEHALSEVIDYSELDRNRELGGFLIGGWHEHQRAYVEVRHFLPAVDAESKAASLTFTHETWAAINRDVEARFPEDVIVGWHHTHPDFGIFLSAYDLFIHRNFFRQPWQIAMVVDPNRQEFGFFQWRDHKVVDCGFICVWDSE